MGQVCVNGGQDVDVGFKERKWHVCNKWNVCSKFMLSLSVKVGAGVCEEVVLVRGSPQGGAARGLALVESRKNVVRKADVQQLQQVDDVLHGEHVVARGLLAIDRRPGGADRAPVARLRKNAGAAAGRGTTGRAARTAMSSFIGERLR